MSQVILVNEHDEAIGTMDKMQAHEEAVLHRAFSIFIFNKDGKMLLQQRADDKYHSGGLWTNACCSHPMPGEETIEAANRRLKEELGFTTTLTYRFGFTYKSDFENGLTEHEYDHVYTGVYEGEIKPDQREIKDWTFFSIEAINDLLESNPARFTTWFKIAFTKLESYLAGIRY
ncbi:MAG: isopentenyl-diphosphate Delta-isomerase [Ferruginibacter sp.]